jgi:branched-chain amino acid transport system permease protein
MEFIAIINAVINGIVLGTLLSLPILAITNVSNAANMASPPC